ncbi:MAG: TonB-dependent receptor [Myxococcales bacterium]|nr:TonB-dependent receptor [Myxococcales bacterium]
MALIQKGELELGVEELKEAYSIKPHPNVLFNIARAYEGSGKVLEALGYYRRYLDFSPPDAATVEPTVVRLEASLPRPSAIERPAQPTPAPLASVDEETLRKLSVLAARLESAVERAERAAAPPPPPPEPAAELVADEVEEGVPYEETVVTASRRAQSTLEAPNATTIITAEEIRLSGAHTLPELLRRVPGAEVAEMGLGSANVSFRGFNQRIANKVLVLVDGRTEYQDFLGITLWPAMPVGLDEVERIEVIRGPGSALYGANAMLGVINLITRSPGTGPAAEFHGAIGNGDAASGSFVASGGQHTVRYRASVGYQQADKWSRDYADGRPDVAAQTFDPALALRSARGNLTTHYALSRDFSVSASAGVNRLFTEIYPIGVLRNFFIDGLGGYAKADLNAGPAKLRFFWNHLSASAGPQYAPIGQRSLATHLESNVFDGELVFGREFSLLGVHRLDAGASARLKRLSWDYMAGLKSELHAAAFVQDEWRLAAPIRVVASYRIDRHPLLSAGQPGYAQSPRVSLWWAPAEGHALRATAATAFREPTFLESYTDVRVPLPGINGGSALTQGNTTLRAERLVAYELGYRGEQVQLGLDWDFALYQHDVTDLISLTAPARLPPEKAWDESTGTFLLGRSTFANEAAAYTARGAEVGLKYTPVDRLDLKASAALQGISSAAALATCGPCTQAPALKLFGGVSYRSRADLDLSFDASYTSPTVWVEREPAPSDPTQIAALENPLPGYAVLNARVGYHLWGDRATLALVGTHLGAAHAEHPFGNLIERRVLATVAVVP